MKLIQVDFAPKEYQRPKRSADAQPRWALSAPKSLFAQIRGVRRSSFPFFAWFAKFSSPGGRSFFPTLESVASVVVRGIGLLLAHPAERFIEVAEPDLQRKEITRGLRESNLVSLWAYLGASQALGSLQLIHISLDLFSSPPFPLPRCTCPPDLKAMLLFTQGDTSQGGKC